jgi:polyisoprenoid-binding protein YceI
MKKLTTRIIFFALSTAFVNGYSQTNFLAEISDERNILKFESEAPLETIIGVTNRIGVRLSLDLNDISKNVKGKAIVDVGSLKTGIDLRDRDMKGESFFNTEKFPIAEFTLLSFSNANSTELKDGKKISATANGKLTIHGVTRNVAVPVILSYLTESANTKTRVNGNLLIVNSTFTIKMTDYGLKIPAFLFYKLQDEIKISLSFVATDEVKPITSLPSIDKKGSKGTHRK